MHSLIQWFLWHSTNFNQTWKNLREIINNILCLVKCLFVPKIKKTMLNLNFSYYPRPMYPGKHGETQFFPFWTVLQTPKWGHAGRQIRVNAWTGSYKLKWKPLFDGWVLGVLKIKGQKKRAHQMEATFWRLGSCCSEQIRAWKMGTSDKVRGYHVFLEFCTYKLKWGQLFDG